MHNEAIPRYLLATLPAHIQYHTTDVLVIGGGAAGLTAALSAAEHARVTLLTRAPALDSNSAQAQGGIAAALDQADSPVLHCEDTLIAGADLCDHEAVAVLTREAPALMRELAGLGVPFERQANGFALGLEGGHTHRRILHVGDATGWALTAMLDKRVRNHEHIHLLDDYQAVDLSGTGGRCNGVLARDSSGTWHMFRAGATIMATGGAGALFGLTSNHPDALGEGIALAYRAGAEVADMEFIQFHPTVMRTQSGRGFLISEAARGEGGRLLTPDGYRFMPDYDRRAELAPRDVVTRGILAAMRQHGANHVLLDLTHLTAEHLQQRFPTIYARCRAEGFDPAVVPIPVAPAAHYLMGGIRTNLWGATSLTGLYAAGECACTGVHGANRLASNSLLECLVFGRRAAMAAVEGLASLPMPVRTTVGERRTGIAHQNGQNGRNHSARPTSFTSFSQNWRLDLATLMRTYAGPLRSGEGLREALRQLDVAPLPPTAANADMLTMANAVLVARLIVENAWLRAESRGGHFRTDFPATNDAWRIHMVAQRGNAPYAVETIAAPLSELAAA